MLDKLRLILYLILIFIGLIALLYIAPIFFIVSIFIFGFITFCIFCGENVTFPIFISLLF